MENTEKVVRPGEKDGREAAFATPSCWSEVDGGTFAERGQYGLTKREYFAAHLMTGLLALNVSTQGVPPGKVPEAMARKAVELADALLAALEGRPDAPPRGVDVQGNPVPF